MCTLLRALVVTALSPYAISHSIGEKHESLAVWFTVREGVRSPFSKRDNPQMQRTLIGYGLLAMWAPSRAGSLKTYHPAAHPQARVGLIIAQFEALPEQAKVDALANSIARRAKMPAGARDKARSRQLAKHEEERDQLKALSDAGGMGTDLSLGHHLACLHARELARSSRSLQSSIIILKQLQRFQILTGRSGSASVTCLMGRRCRSCSRTRNQHKPERTTRQGRSLLAQGSSVYSQQTSMMSRALLAEGVRLEKRGSSESKVDQELFPDFTAKFVDEKTLLSCVLDLIKVIHERDLRSDWSRLSERLE